ncbi:hypothetical protein AYO22_07629 [Fonsecaea multimorphosa]|nr:hypothetical protein AYO22_07629 [Fonsecaea multimorphosa]
MSSVIADAGANLSPLTGPANYEEWAHAFQIACLHQGIWKLFTGTEYVRSPDEHIYEDQIKRVKTELEAKICEDRYNRWCEEFKLHEDRIEHAMAFLAESVDPSIRDEVLGFDRPKPAWKKLAKMYKMRKPSLVEIEQKNMDSLEPRDCASLTDFLSQFNGIRKKLVAAGGDYGESESKLKIISGLEPQYIARLNREVKLKEIDDMSLKTFIDLLLSYELDL